MLYMSISPSYIFSQRSRVIVAISLAARFKLHLDWQLDPNRKVGHLLSTENLQMSFSSMAVRDRYKEVKIMDFKPAPQKARH